MHNWLLSGKHIFALLRASLFLPFLSLLFGLFIFRPDSLNAGRTLESSKSIDVQAPY